MAMAVPSLSDWQEERQLDLAAEELASAIREAETEARSETSRYGNVVARTYFFCAQDGDHVSYFTRKGTTTIRPKGSFPENIRGTGNLNLTLRKDGYAVESSKYSMYLRTKDGKYRGGGVHGTRSDCEGRMRREGFLLVWAAAALAIVMTLGAGVFLSVSVAARREAEREISLDETLIAQDAMEQMKASVRLGEPVSMPKEIVRNGRTYTVDMTEEPVYVESVPMRRMKAEVSDSSGNSVSFSVLMEDPQ